MDRVVLCMKWGTLYGPDYVNVLFNAVRAHLPGPFRFVCLTDDATGIDPGVDCFPVPEFGLRPDLWQIGGWPKIGVFQRDLYGLRGRALFIDLDMMILSDLTPFFDHPAPFIATDMGANWKPRAGKGPEEPGTCLFAFTLGAEPQIYERFNEDRNGNAHRFGLEQNCVAAFAHSVTCWPADWVISFKRHLRPPALLGTVLPVRRPPASAKVLAFHGRPRPLDLIRKGWWGELPNIGRGPVGWMRDYWLRYGGN
ncbi:hypothetical protein ACTTAL_15245 [Rhodobacter capsulatus]|uniref:hypothetical protein n=1 Tax=Rhodobacter capsulatus TaxID=1061 RepID=UPI0003D34C9D|nr:hypothetical protein [Rhodobacter capsulatus]ETD83873.1 glycosyltransferase [Rhodobacter capsulatus YW1]ETD88712.1 glycosyltransferase [Rhodobacter capsulatus YW2]